MTVSDDAQADASPIRMEVLLPADARFRELRHRVPPRLAACLGCAGTDAVARAVGLATSGVLDHPAGAVYSSVMVTLSAGAGVLTIRVRYLLDPGAEATPAVGRILRGGGGDAPLLALQRLASRVDIGRADDAECCTLILPCSAPPAAT